MVMVTMNSLQLYIKKRTFSASFTLSVKGKINNEPLQPKKRKKERKLYIEHKVFLTCCFSGTVCHKKIKIETKMIVFQKQLLKAFHNIEHEPFEISMEIFLSICFAYIYYAHFVCAKETC